MIFYRNPELAAFIAFKSIRSQLNRERKKSRPKLPESITMLVDELNQYIPTNHIYKGTAKDGKKALLFYNNELLQALESSTEIFCDGIFSVSFITIYYIYFIILKLSINIEFDFKSCSSSFFS